MTKGKGAFAYVLILCRLRCYKRMNINSLILLVHPSTVKQLPVFSIAIRDTFLSSWVRQERKGKDSTYLLQACLRSLTRLDRRRRHQEATKMAVMQHGM